VAVAIDGHAPGDAERAGEHDIAATGEGDAIGKLTEGHFKSFTTRSPDHGCRSHWDSLCVWDYILPRLLR
jgi:hypothetical protein